MEIKFSLTMKGEQEKARAEDTGKIGRGCLLRTAGSEIRPYRSDPPLTDCQLI